MVLDRVEKIPPNLLVEEFLASTQCSFEDFNRGVYSMLPAYLEFSLE
jgi:hypothetical protein